MEAMMRTRFDRMMSNSFGRIVMGGLSVVASVVGKELYWNDFQKRGRKDGDCAITVDGS